MGRQVIPLVTLVGYRIGVFDNPPGVIFEFTELLGERVWAKKTHGLEAKSVYRLSWVFWSTLYLSLRLYWTRDSVCNGINTAG